MRKYIRPIIMIVVVIGVISLVLIIHKRWSCKPIDTDVTKIETIFIITHGKEIELSQKGIEELLTILDKVRYKKISNNGAETGTLFIINILYKDGRKKSMAYYGWDCSDLNGNYYMLMHSKELMDFAKQFNE